MRGSKLKFGSVFECDHPFARSDPRSKRVEQTRLARRRGSTNEHVASVIDQGMQQIDHSALREVAQHTTPHTEPTHCEAGAIDSDWRNHGTHTRAIGQASIDNGRQTVEPPTNGIQHAFDDARRDIASQSPCKRRAPLAFDPDIAAVVHHDLVHEWVDHVVMQRSQARCMRHGGQHNRLKIVLLSKRKQCARKTARGLEQLGVGTVLGRQLLADCCNCLIVSHAARSLSATASERGSRDASRPASTARATAGSVLISATTGACTA